MGVLPFGQVSERAASSWMRSAQAQVQTPAQAAHAAAVERLQKKKKKKKKQWRPLEQLALAQEDDNTADDPTGMAGRAAVTTASSS